jgi:hypothetical protein
VVRWKFCDKDKKKNGSFVKVKVDFKKLSSRSLPESPKICMPLFEA